jgi:hypothetical protein
MFFKEKCFPSNHLYKMYISANKVKEFRELNKPNDCPILWTKIKNPVLDHDHQTGEVRGVIDNNANNLIGVIENKFFSYCAGNKADLPDVLRRVADYLDRPRTGYLHPVGLNQLVSRFKRKHKDEQLLMLSQFTFVEENEIKACINTKHRAKLYRTLLKTFYETKTTKDSERVERSKNSVQ